MSAKESKAKDREEAKAEGPEDFAKMCREMMSGGMPECCGPEIMGKMSQFMAAFQAGEQKPA